MKCIIHYYLLYLTFLTPVRCCSSFATSTMPATSLMSSCTVSPPPMKVKGSTIETPADRNANFTCLPLPPNSLMFLYDNYFFYLFPYKLYCTVSFCEYVLWYFCTHGSVHAGLCNYLSLTSPQHSLHCMALITWLNLLYTEIEAEERIQIEYG